jgi:hypothetical protein
MKQIKGFIIGMVMFALAVGCAPKRIPEEKWERIPLSQVLPQTLRKYEGVNTLQSRLFVQLELRDEYYVLQGVLLYERPARLRLRLNTNLGGTVGEVIFNEGRIFIILPSEGKIYRGWIEEGESPKGETYFLTMAYSDDNKIEGLGFPTRISGEGEVMGIRFDMKLKDPQVNFPLPERAFVLPKGEWEIHPLEDLKDLLQKIEAGAGS